MRGLNYWDKLKTLNMTSLQRRLEWYRIIYVWKILKKNPKYFNIQDCLRSQVIHKTVKNVKCEKNVKIVKIVKSEECQ